jgi:hypothetical protein
MEQEIVVGSTSFPEWLLAHHHLRNSSLYPSQAKQRPQVTPNKRQVKENFKKITSLSRNNAQNPLRADHKHTYSVNSSRNLHFDVFRILPEPAGIPLAND